MHFWRKLEDYVEVDQRQRCVLPRLLSPYLHTLAGPRRSLESKHKTEGREKRIHKQTPSGNDDDDDVIELQSDMTY